MSLEQEATVIQLTDHCKGHGDKDEHDHSFFKCANRPITLRFEDVVYKIRARKHAGSIFFLEKNSRAEEIPILRGITGIVRPGEMLGILGPSGSGKTTLLTALGSRLGGGRLEGTVTYNGKPYLKGLKRATGFVTQDDAMYPHLTVAETLIYTALVRLPNTFTASEKVKHAEAVITQLGLTKCVGPEDEHGDGDTMKHKFISAYKDCLEPKLKDDLHRIENVFIDEEQQYMEFGAWPTTWWQQFVFLLQRGIKERKHNLFDSMKIAQVLFIGLLCGLLWSRSSIHNLQDKVGLLFYHSSFWGYSPILSAISTFPIERKMLEKERSSGMYRLSSYFMARIVGDLPLELFLPTVYLIITYWMSGMNPDPKSVFLTLLVLLYSVLASHGVGLAIGALMMDMHKAITLGITVMMTFLLAEGYYVQRVPSFIGWMRYLSISYYTYKLFLGSQFDEHSTYPCGDGGTCLVREDPAVREVGLGGQAVAIVALGIMIVGYRVVAYIALMRVGVTKTRGTW
ncbi:hypothetical protein MLD38_011290 [Melastoma candidum]|uniref:Uncharacterized protein n=1 Tax=Melastoma candidum TaxID=119954 RepID=A0ACB9R5L1_9MYRT|nr:hypothetical protein MLD38_011290 [Melastoma candidum]